MAPNVKKTILKAKPSQPSKAESIPSIADIAAFKAWAPADIAAKKAAFSSQLQTLHGPMTKELAMKFKVHDYFTPLQMSGLWVGLNRKDLPQTSVSTQAHWQELKTAGVGTGKVAKKNQILVLSLTMPITEWGEFVCEITDEVRKTHSKSIFSQWKLEGEMEVKHGRRFFKKLKRMKFFETRQVKGANGLVQYCDEVVTEEKIASRIKSTKVTKKAELEDKQKKTKKKHC